MSNFAVLVTVCGLLLSEAACSSPEPAPRADAASAAPVADRTSMLPKEGLTNARVIPDHVLGIARLPGGSAGDYTLKGQPYQLFIIDAGTSQKAAFLLLDCKAIMHHPEYIAYMGGYAGSDGNRDLYVFAKNQYLAGVAGLDKVAADPIAIQLASRLR